MNAKRGTARARDAATALVLFALAVACERKAEPRATAVRPPAPDSPAAAPPVGPSPVLRVPPDTVSRVEVIRHDLPAPEQRVVLERRANGWRVTSPVDAPASEPMVDAILGVLGELAVTPSAEAAPSHGVARQTAIEVAAWSGEERRSAFTLGAQRRGETSVTVPGDERLFVARGRCRRPFEAPLAELRDPVITDLDVAKVARVRFSNAAGVLDLVPAAREPGLFAKRGAAPRSFDEERAGKAVRVLAELRAMDFVDAPASSETLRLPRKNTPKAEVWLRDASGAEPLTLWFGELNERGLLPLRTSAGPQVYLVSGHLVSSLLPQPSHYEQSDAELQALRAAPQSSLHASDEDHEHGSPRGAEPGATAAPHRHGPPPEPPRSVPPELLDALRTLAREQGARP